MTNNSPWSCTIASWVVATLIGILAAALLYFLGDWRAVQAIALGVVLLLLAGVFLTQVMCGDSAWGAIPAKDDGAAANSAAMTTPMPAASVATAAPAPAATKKPAAKKAAPKKAPAKKPAAKKPAAKKAAAKPPVLFEKRPDQVDDLKLISGVGPKLENTLHEVGVYQFAQVANWKKADVALVDSKLKFKGRIERDDWIKQAKILAKGGETEFSARKKK